MLREILTEESRRKYITVFVLILIGAFLCEIFIFNFKWINSAFDKPIALGEPSLSDITRNGDSLQVNGDSASIEFKNIDKKLKFLYFNPGDEKDNIKANITVSAVDEANSYGISAPQRTVISSVKPSQYIRLHFSGEVQSLKISISNMKNKSLNLSDIGLNVHVPLMFSWIRFLVLTLICMLLFILRPKSSVYSIITDLTKKKQRIAATILLVVEIISFCGIINWNTVVKEYHNTVYYNQQYYDLVDAFKHGHLYTHDDAPEALKTMENPYDIGARNAKGISYRWDSSFYNGKYYCYFGVAPAVLLYLPYNLITGQNLPNYMAIIIFGSISFLGVMLLLWEIIKKWFNKTPFAVYLLLSFVFPMAAIVSYVAYKPDFYVVPNTSAIMFAVFGLVFWLMSERTGKNGVTVLSSKMLASGSACVAMTALCRPQFLITAIFGVIFFWDYAFKERRLFSKKGINQTLAICLPFVIIGLITMMYNSARFGSPFDFGANYNLTTNDMTHRGFVLGRIGYGIFSYLLQPLSVNAIFPFIHDFGIATVYQGLTLSEYQMGGVLWLYPILIAGICGALKMSLFVGDKRAYRFVYSSVLMAVLVVILDTEMAGLLTRYFTDFIWLLMLSTSMTIFALYNKYTDMTSRKTLGTLTITLSGLTLVLVILGILCHREYPLNEFNPNIYYSIQHMIAFWM